MNLPRTFLWTLLLVVGAGCGSYTAEWKINSSAMRIAWSWDGVRLAYTHERNGVTDLFVTNDDWTWCTRLAVGTTGTFAWSPNGARLAYVTRDTSTGLLDLWSVRADGSDLRPITSGRSRIGLPIWSPDGTRLAFTTSEFPGLTALHTALADGTGLVRVDAGSLLVDFDWSPDGDRIAYLVSDGGLDFFTLRCASADGAERRDLSGPGLARSGGIAWSPDGARLLYRTEDALYSVRHDGTERLQLSAWQVLDGFAWSPDGLYVAYRVAGVHFELWVVRNDGSAPFQVTANLANDWLNDSFAWSWDGAWLAFRTALDGLVSFDPVSRAFVDIDVSVGPGFVWAPAGENLAYRTTEGVLHTALAATGHSTPIADSLPGFVWAPDGDALLFVHEGVYTAGVDGAVSLVSNLSVAGKPMWSPSGERVAFGAHQPDGSVRLYVAWPHGGATPVLCGDAY